MRRVTPYFILTAKYFAIAAAVSVLNSRVCSLIPLAGWEGLAVSLAFCAATSFAAVFAFFGRGEEFAYFAALAARTSRRLLRRAPAA
jgi:UDP-N-acetylmuramyl pentapeptide phosphotransferase/UDP-N-acetylglucosamine-1-phosphate transferase